MQPYDPSCEPAWTESGRSSAHVTAAIRARVRTVEPAAFTKVSALGIEEQRANVVADFVDPPAPLGDGYRVEARTIIWEAERVLKVPASALFRYGDGWSVFVVESGKALRREVEIGYRSQFEAEVLKGIEAGAQVVLHPPTRLVTARESSRDDGDSAHILFCWGARND